LAEDTLLKGTVLEIQRMSTEDGPGIRTTVFMKGCPMHCLWCHNPESISSKPQIQWIGIRCIGCRTCLSACPNSGLYLSEEGMAIDREKCASCGTCTEECPSTALELIGKDWAVSDLMDELLKDSAFFAQSDGGITISGGEATLQWRFVSELLKGIKSQGFHTAIDTCGIIKPEAMDAILPFTDLVLFDLKEMDPQKHLEYTGAPLDIVLGTFREVVLRKEQQQAGIELWVRTPLIPGKTARIDNITAIGQFIGSVAGDAVSRWDLLAFNNLCKDKYTRLGMEWEFEGSALIGQEELNSLGAAARKSGVDSNIIHVTGSTRMENEDMGLLKAASKPICAC
jgi:pyruvate formate lyase activating enzyme